jgi:xanthine dehydrogenase YagS FAD-binding subunit
MHPTIYERAADAAVALKLLSENAGAKFLAGGTTLVDLMKLDVERPTKLVDIKRVALSDIKRVQEGIEIGALATNTTVADHELIKSNFPVLSQAILAGATQQIRNMASVGGNLLQRTRCPYFRDNISPCNKREPGTGCSAKEGVNDKLAVLGTSEACYATSAGDMPVALMALDAVVRVTGAGGPRELPIDEFFVVPGKTPHIENRLKRDELITAVFIPTSNRAKHSAYFKTRDRASYEFALASCAAAIELDGGVVRSAAIAVGGVATKPWRAKEAEAILNGQKPTDDLFKRAADAAFAEAKPLTGNAFKIELGKRVMLKTLKSLTTT